MGERSKKIYKLYLNKSFEPQQVSKWTRMRWKKILLSHNDAKNFADSIKRSSEINSVTNNQNNDSLQKNMTTVNAGEPMIQDIIVQSSNQLYESENKQMANVNDNDNSTLRTVLIQCCCGKDDCKSNLECHDSDDTPFDLVDSEQRIIDHDSESEVDDYDEHDPVDSELETNDSFFTKKTAVMFTESNLTISEVVFLLLGIKTKYSFITKDFLIVLINFVKLLAGPRFSSWNFSPYLLSKKLTPPTDKSYKHYYCPKCNIDLLKIEMNKNVSVTLQCPKCEQSVKINSQSLDYFMTTSIRFQLELLLNRRDIQEQLKKHEMNREMNKNDDNCIRDIYDGTIYKDIQEIFPGALTFNFNTDGAQLFNSAKKSLWPLQLHVNDLPPDIRFKHLILAGLWQTEHEPTPEFLNLYLHDFVEECNDLLLNGIKIIDQDTKQISYRKVIPLFCCVDSVARPKMQNRIMFNGYHGCSWCYQRGVHEGNSMRYPVLTEENHELRTHEKHKRDAEEASKLGKMINGIKGKSILMDLKYFDMVWSFPVEYMHGNLLGVNRQLWNKWNSSFSKADRELIKTRMSNIKLCRDIRRSLRSVVDYANKLKATEWKTWHLLLSLPCLKDVLQNDLFHSYALYVESTYNNLKDCIPYEEIDESEYNLFKFAGESETMYGVEFVTFNLHSSVHYATTIRLCGSIWSYSAFPFENGIYQFLTEINGPNGCLKQIFEKWLKRSIFENFLANTTEQSDAIEFCKSLFNSKPLLQNAKFIDNTTVIGIASTSVVVQKQIREYTKDNLVVADLYNSFIYKSIFYHSSNYSRTMKTNDSVIQTQDSRIYEIDHLVVASGKCYIYGREWIVGDNGFSKDVNKPLASHIYKVLKKTSVKVVLEISKLKRKVIVIDIKEAVYISFFPNTYEVQ